MPAPISFAQTANDYPPDNTDGAPILGPLQQVVSITFQVSGNCFYQLAKKTKSGSVAWDEIDLPAQTGSGGFSGKCYGIKFKSAVSGMPVTVSAVAFFPDDAVPFQQIQAGSGGGGGSSVETTDGITTVSPTTELLIGSGLVLSNPGLGIAELKTEIVVVGAQVRAASLDTPDSSGFAFPSVSTSNGFTNVKRVLPYFAHGGTGSWTTSIRIPADYGSSPSVSISCVVNTNSGVIRWVVGTAVVPVGTSEDTAFTLETPQNISVPATALKRYDVSFNITGTVPVANADLNIQVQRQGGNVADTCTFVSAVWAVVFSYTPV